MITEEIIYGTAGNNFVTKPSIAYVTPLCVCRAGTEFDVITSGTATGRFVLYTASAGKLTFANDLEPYETDVHDSEPIYIMYKY